MIGIQDIGAYVCDKRESNIGKVFDNEVIDNHFLLDKVGVKQIAVKDDNEKASDLCVKAFNNLMNKNPKFDKNMVDCICVCSQNRDYMIPHTSAIVHGKLELSEKCAVFDISLGCSGYVYSLSLMKSFMEQNGLRCGLLFTSDPLTDIIDKDDKSTSIVFGDGATVTLLSENIVYSIGKSSFYSDGKNADVLIRDYNGYLKMDGRVVLSFALGNINNVINDNLNKEDLSVEDIDLFIFHQASKYIMDRVAKRLNLEQSKVPFDIFDYGNTSSSTIPIILEKNLNKNYNKILLCGFGVGLSIASLIIKKEK